MCKHTQYYRYMASLTNLTELSMENNPIEIVPFSVIDNVTTLNTFVLNDEVLQGGDDLKVTCQALLSNAILVLESPLEGVRLLKPTSLPTLGVRKAKKGSKIGGSHLWLPPNL